MTASEEHLRTQPDIVIFAPDDPCGPDGQNQHLNAIATPGGALLATWTSASVEGADNQRVMFSRSADGGKTWSPPQMLDGAGPEDGPGTGMASWQFLIPCPGVLPGGGSRIWCFYTKNVGVDDARAADTGVLRGRFSDDDGISWSRETFDYPIAPNAISNPDPSVPPVWIVYQNPTTLPDGSVIAGFTRWASDAVDPGADMLHRMSECCFLRFENILSEPDPAKLVVTTWPAGSHGLRVESPERPGVSVAQEPSVQPLPDGRLICVMRTLRGMLYFALSGDGGRSWDEPRPLRYAPDGEPLKNPLAPPPSTVCATGGICWCSSTTTEAATADAVRRTLPTCAIRPGSRWAASFPGRRSIL